MPLDKPTLISDIKAIHNNMKARTNNQQGAIDDYAKLLADAIEKYVKSGLVVVNTTGSASAQAGTGEIT